MMLSPGLLLVVIPVALAQFLYPPQGCVFGAGETQTIRWHTTFSNFTIGLWQQALAGGSAALGPILIQTTENGPSVTQFDWVVQIYGFDLGISNRFFFWLVQGDVTQQGNQSAPAISSPYFLIAEQNSSSSSVSSQFIMTTSETSRTSTLLLTASSITNVPSSSSTSGHSDGLSVGSRTGIAVGAVLVGVAAVSGVIYWIRRSRKNQKELVIRLEQQTARLNEQRTYEQAPLGKPVIAMPTPLEKANGHYTGPVELG